MNAAATRRPPSTGARRKARKPAKGKPTNGQRQQSPRASAPRSRGVTGTRGGPLLRAYPGRHLGPLPLGPVIAWQVALGLIALGLAYRNGWLLTVAIVVGVAVGGCTLVWWNGRPLWRWFKVWRGFRARSAKAAPALPHDPALVPLREWLPALELATVEGKRGAEQVGVSYDGTGYTILLGPDREDLIASADPVNIPLSALASVGEAEGIRLASAQLVVQTLPAPVPALGAYGGQLAQSYTEINASAAPAMVSWWIALRLEPSRDGTALTLDGDDPAAVRRALRTGMTWATKVLSSSGLPCRPLSKSEVREVLALTLGVDPHHRPTSLQARRTNETWRSWACDGTTHVSGWVRSWPKGGVPGMSALLSTMAAQQVWSSTASLTVSWSPENELRWSGFVRIVGENSKTARAAYRRLAKQASRAKVGLVRLDGEQMPGVLATIPLGGHT